MTDSIDRPDGTPMPPEVRERFSNTTAAQNKENIANIPRWAKTAMAQHDVLGLTWKEAARRHNKTPGTLGNYKKSPAGRAWRAQIGEFVDDPVEVSKAVLRGNSASFTIDYMLVLQSAIEAGDYKEAGKMLRDLHDRLGITEKKQAAEVGNIVIQLPGSSDDVPMIEAEYEVVDDDES